MSLFAVPRSPGSRCSPPRPSPVRRPTRPWSSVRRRARTGPSRHGRPALPGMPEAWITARSGSTASASSRLTAKRAEWADPDLRAGPEVGRVQGLDRLDPGAAPADLLGIDHEGPDGPRRASITVRPANCIGRGWVRPGARPRAHPQWLHRRELDRAVLVPDEPLVDERLHPVVLRRAGPTHVWRLTYVSTPRRGPAPPAGSSIRTSAVRPCAARRSTSAGRAGSAIRGSPWTSGQNGSASVAGLRSMRTARHSRRVTRSIASRNGQMASTS